MFLEIIIAFFVIMITLCLLYSIPILSIRRFRHLNNALTLNICLAVTVCAVYHIFYMMIILQWSILPTKPLCYVIEYMRIMVLCQVTYAFITVAVHRFCSIVYFNKALFKKTRWLVGCIISQWIVGFIVSIPHWPDDSPICTFEQWTSIYSFIISIVLPALICVILNLRLYVHVHTSSRRVQCQSITLAISSGRIEQHRQPISRRDLRLLMYMMYTFSIFVVGWGPFYFSLILTYSLIINVYVYVVLAIWAEASVILLIITLFIYNKELRQFLREKLPRCC